MRLLRAATAAAAAGGVMRQTQLAISITFYTITFLNFLWAPTLCSTGSLRILSLQSNEMYHESRRNSTKTCVCHASMQRARTEREREPLAQNKTKQQAEQYL